MKRFNVNSILFVFAGIFVLVGLSLRNIRPVLGSFKNVLTGSYTIEEAKKNIDTVTSEELIYHTLLMDVNSVKENLLGTKIVIKANDTIVKSESGSLVNPVWEIDKSEIQEAVSKTAILKEISEYYGASFLYCAAPKKELYQIVPSNVENYFKDNYSLFIGELSNSKVPTVDFDGFLSADNPVYDTFYRTDHHWTVRSGFEATNTILHELNTRYGFEYDEQYCNLLNYSIEKYKKWFLGSKGKKVGTYFTWDGADDFDLIIPKFKTDFIEEQPFKDQIRTGEFKDTVLYLENMKKDYYRVNTYATYSGGDFRLQIIRNNLNHEGKKIVLIRDSSACVVAPFLALQTSELHICDMRNEGDYVGEKLNIEEYINQIRPDYVLVLYTGVGIGSDSRYDFF